MQEQGITVYCYVLLEHRGAHWVVATDEPPRKGAVFSAAEHCIFNPTDAVHKVDPAIINACVLRTLQFLHASVLHVVNYLKQPGLAHAVLLRLPLHNQDRASQTKPTSQT